MKEDPYRNDTGPKDEWCSGGGSSVPPQKMPNNGHKRCKDCGRIVSIIGGKIRPHVVVPDTTRYTMDERVRNNNVLNATEGEF